MKFQSLDCISIKYISCKDQIDKFFIYNVENELIAFVTCKQWFMRERGTRKNSRREIARNSFFLLHANWF